MDISKYIQDIQGIHTSKIYRKYQATPRREPAAPVRPGAPRGRARQGATPPLVILCISWTPIFWIYLNMSNVCIRRAAVFLQSTLIAALSGHCHIESMLVRCCEMIQVINKLLTATQRNPSDPHRSASGTVSAPMVSPHSATKRK